MSISPSWQLLAALILLLTLAVVASKIGRFGFGKALVWAGFRAGVQLLVVSFIVVAAIGHLWSSALFVLVMFSIAVYTTAKRVGTMKSWQWTALALASGAVPVLIIIFITQTAPFNGYSLLPIGSIIVGNMMTVHTFNGRRIFPELRNQLSTYEAALSLGFQRYRAIRIVLRPVAGEALVPRIDDVRTVGLVTLPGAFIGVLLGGGTPLEAGASQLLVFIGIITGQTLVVVAMNRLIERAKLLPDDLKQQLRA